MMSWNCTWPRIARARHAALHFGQFAHQAAQFVVGAFDLGAGAVEFFVDAVGEGGDARADFF
jgi:hypothetical protein